MNTPLEATYTMSPSPDPPTAPATPTPHAGPGRPKGSGTGAKRGRKPRGGSAAAASPATSSPQFQQLSWSLTSTTVPTDSSLLQGTSFAGPKPQSSIVTSGIQAYGTVPPQATPRPPTPGYSSTFLRDLAASANISLEAAGLSGTGTPGASGSGARVNSMPPAKAGGGGGDEEGEADDELFPAMADDDYSAQLNFQSESKDNLKVLMENLSPEQYDRFEAYRRHALPKQAVRKVIQQTVGAQVSQPVAQIIAGFSKVFVGEIVEKARAVQARRGESGPLSPDHLREAYRMYQDETGKVGAAKPVRGKKLFVR